MSPTLKSTGGGSLWAKISGSSRWSKPLLFGSAESEHPRLTDGEIISEEFQPLWSQSTSVGIDLKELGGSAAEMFEILPRNWSFWPIFTQKWASVDLNWGVQPPPTPRQFQPCNPPTLQTDGRTDRQTPCDRKTALCTKVHRCGKERGRISV